MFYCEQDHPLLYFIPQAKTLKRPIATKKSTIGRTLSPKCARVPSEQSHLHLKKGKVAHLCLPFFFSVRPVPHHHPSTQFTRASEHSSITRNAASMAVRCDTLPRTSKQVELLSFSKPDIPFALTITLFIPAHPPSPRRPPLCKHTHTHTYCTI